MDTRLLSAREAAEALGVSLSSIRRWTASGHLNPVRLGPKLLKYRREELDALVGEPRNDEAPVRA